MQSRRELKRFVAMAWRLYRGDRDWVPQLVSDQLGLLERSGPFFEHADGLLLYAERGGEPIGRVVAYDDRECPEPELGGLGFFECIDDPDVARAMLERAEDWLRGRGKTRARGPISPNMQLGSVGMLVDGEPGPPAILMPYNPPYYARLFETCGYEKGQDLFALCGEIASAPIDEGLQLVSDFEAAGFRFRSLNKKRLLDDVRAITAVRNAAYAHANHYAFTNTTDGEAQYLADHLDPIADPDLIVLVERDGKVVGENVMLPDVSPVLRVLNGRLGPIRLIRALLAKRRVDNARIADIAVVPDEQHRRLGAAMNFYALARARENGYRTWETSWVAESNVASLKNCARTGARETRRYRVYERAL